MHREQDFKSALPVWGLMTIPVLWLAVIAAYAYEDGMTVFDWMGQFSVVIQHPFAIHWTAHTLKFMLGALVLYAFAIVMYYTSRHNRRPGEEYGSAAWGDPKKLNAKYRDKDPSKNVILSRNIQMGLDGRKHRRNLLQIVVGGSGAGKTRFFCLPNLMLANTSYIVTDPKGEMLRSVAPLLLRRGYVIRVFDLVDLAHSDRFNPFRYIRKDTDVLRLVDNLIKNTTPKNAQQNDPFWEKSEIALDSAIFFYLLYEAPPEEQTMEMVMYMLNHAGAREDSDDYQSPLDLLFEALEEEQPDHIAVKQYKIYAQAPGKTRMSIIISAAVRLAAFNISSVAGVTAEDDMELGKLGEHKQAIFCVVPDSNDNSLNYLVGMLYTCAFQELYYSADRLHGGRLPVPVRLIMDEFANVSLPDGYARLQSTMRSRNVMSTIILQNISQLKALFRNDWEGIIGNADCFIYLGGNEKESHKYISELLGKETIDTQTASRSRGRNGSYSQNFQQTGRELMTPDEVRMLDNDYEIVLLRGERPVIDLKYDVLKHPNVKYTETGGAEPYTHRPGVSYALPDLPFEFTSLDELEFLEETA